MKKLLFATAVFVIGLQTTVFCQGDSLVLKGAFSNLKTLLTDHVIEKAYLHFDRPYPLYVAGEIVYFKAYVVMGERHEPSAISGILHVDLIDRNNVLMQTAALQLRGGTGWGDFVLPDNLQKGSYRIRAYTEWMRNEKTPQFFEQSISVSSVNSVDRVAENTAQTAQADLQFFPEGGSLVATLPSKIAFKAIGTNGLGVGVTGVVVDNQNKEVAKLASAHLGMGVFTFTPDEGKAYKAKVVFADGSMRTVDLPAVQSKGITLAVNTDDPAKVSIEVRANKEFYKDNFNKGLSLLIYNAGNIKYYKPKLDNSILGLDLPAGNFSSGIVRVTLFSQTGEPLNERLSFVQNPDLLNLSINTNKPSFAKRENVMMSLNAKNKEGNPVNGSFSVSVIDESKILVDENAENSILSYLLLTSDVKGYIEKPNYYFANVNKETRGNLDALMLTQGYRRFVWKELIDNSALTAASFKPEKGLDLSGRLTKKSGEPIANIKLTLIAQAEGLAVSATTDDGGRFHFNNLVYTSDTHFILKTQSSVGKNMVLTFDESYKEPVIDEASPVESRYNANADILASLQNSQRQGMITASSESTLALKDDKFTGVKRDDNYRSSNIGGSGHADQVISGEQVKNLPTLSSGLDGLARGVQFTNGVPILQTGSVVTNGNQVTEPMLLIIDGIDAGRGTSVDEINPQSVETIEILKGPNAAIYGVEGGEGVMIITTRQGTEKDEVVSKEMSPGMFSIQPKGFYKARDFYMPDYAVNPALADAADLRTTIFWKPDVITDANGNAAFSFFNADGKGTYRVVIEGIDNKGNLGRQVFKYKVQ